MMSLIESVIIKAAAMGAPASRMAAAQVLLRAWDYECEAAAAVEYVQSDGDLGRLGATWAALGRPGPPWGDLGDPVRGDGALETDDPWTMHDLEWVRDAIRV